MIGVPTIKLTATTAAGMAAIGLLSLAMFVAFWGTVAYVALHFIGKFW
jgi:hypothetical protein